MISTKGRYSIRILLDLADGGAVAVDVGMVLLENEHVVEAVVDLPHDRLHIRVRDGGLEVGPLGVVAARAGGGHVRVEAAEAALVQP